MTCTKGHRSKAADISDVRRYRWSGMWPVPKVHRSVAGVHRRRQSRYVSSTKCSLAENERQKETTRRVSDLAMNEMTRSRPARRETIGMQRLRTGMQFLSDKLDAVISEGLIILN